MFITSQGARAQQITIVDEHPRLVFRAEGTPGVQTFQTIRDLYNSNNGSNPFRGQVQGWLASGVYGSDPAHEASRFVITGDVTHARNALDSMYNSALNYQYEGYEEGIKWALAYDWIHSAWSGSPDPPVDLGAKLQTIEGKLAAYVNAALSELDGPGPSLWHYRGANAASAWVVSLALPASNSTYDDYRRRAFSHWQQALKAVHASGGWPEGPTYWASVRLINFPAAYQAYQTAVTAAPPLAVSDALGDLRTLGLWQAYTERGDGSFDRYGDVSSQAFISNGTIGRGLDYYARVTRAPALAAFAEHAREYRQPLYHSYYGWMYAIAYDPAIPKPAGYDPARPAACLGAALPHAMLFGRDALGFTVMRQGWNPGDTEISFKAGDYLAHHGHYDQGTFTIFKNAPLVINSGGYGNYFDDHRLNYYVRTVAVNSILVQRPDEMWTPAGVAPPGGYVNDGGQRIVNATGSMVRSYEDWLANKTSGPNYELADITAFANVDGRYSYAASDLTRAYNSTLYDSEGQGGKVSSVTRQLVYLQDADTLVVFDRVASTDPTYKKKWLLHTPNKFIGGSEVVARGTDTNGIIEVDGTSIVRNTMIMTNGGGRLFLQLLTPRRYTVNKVGGPDYRYYVEDDGNDADGYDGTNHSGGYTERAWNDYGDWRIEVSPEDPNAFDTFLAVLTPRESATESVDVAALLSENPLATIMQVGSHIVGFGTHGGISSGLAYTLAGGGTYDHLIVDLLPDQLYCVSDGTGLREIQTNDAGVLAFAETAFGPHDVTVTLSALSGPITWVAGPDDHWENGANWQGGLAPGPISGAVLDSSTPLQPRLYRDERIEHVDFRTAGRTIDGSGFVLAVGAGGVDSAGAGVNSVLADVALKASSTWTVEDSNTLLLSGLLNTAGYTLTKEGNGTLMIAGAQSHTPGSVLALDGGTVAFNTDAGSTDAANLTVDVSGAAVNFGSTQHFAALNINTGSARLTSGGSKAIVTKALSIDAADSFLDLTDNALVVDYTGGPSPFDAIQGYLASGCNGGSWDGLGITSSAAAAHPQDVAALGILDDGETVIVDYTWAGDADLDGVVNSNDYDKIDRAWALWTREGRVPEGGFRWAVGDFNYDGTLDSNDYDKIDTAWLLSKGAPLSSGSLAPTPEPATFALLALGGLGILLRRKGE